jgi:hypothetical protein
MQNIQDLKEKIFFESKNIIGILDKISNVDELLSKQDLVDELANRISFLRLLEKNIEYFGNENTSPVSENKENFSSAIPVAETHDLSNEVTEEEAIFNNELNEIDENETNSFASEITEEEAIFNNQLNEIVEGELHETLVNFAEENSEPEINGNSETKIHNDVTEEEAIFNNQLNEIDENEPSDYSGSALNFVDEERILADSEPENDDDIHEGMFNDETTEEEAIFNNQLNEIDEFENQVSDNDEDVLNDFDEEEKIQDNFESVVKNEDSKETIPSIFDTEILDDDEEILVEETENQFITPNISMEQGEMATDTSNVENILAEIKHDAVVEEKQEQTILAEINDRRKIVDINKPQVEKENYPSDESFENLEQYHQEKKIKLANIKGMKAVQSLFDDDHLDRDMPTEKPAPVEKKEDTGSILKTNIPTDFMEAEKAKPEFRLDLNDRIAFTKTLFGGSQTELNEVVGQLNSFRTLEEAKEYLSDLYYHKKWSKVDEYAQRLWILVENKFL